MNKTKQRIILRAINLYNKRGFTNVLNQDVAKESEISLSNFNSKTKPDAALFAFSLPEGVILEDKR